MLAGTCVNQKALVKIIYRESVNELTLFRQISIETHSTGRKGKGSLRSKRFHMLCAKDFPLRANVVAAF